MGQRVTVRLAEAVPVTGGLVLELLEIEGRGMPGGGAARRGKPVASRAGQAKAAKTGRRVTRQHR